MTGEDVLRTGAGVLLMGPDETRRRPRTAPRGETCRTCKEVHPRCLAHNAKGKPCGRVPRTGHEVCGTHGGKAPQVVAAEQRREVEQKARMVLARRHATGEERPVVDPIGELARVAGEVVAFKDLLREQVAGLNGVLTYWQETEYGDPETETAWTKAGEEVRAIVAAYERAQERAAKVLADMVKIDLVGRIAEINLEQGRAVAGAVRSGLAEVDLPREIREAVQAAIAGHLATLQPPTAALPRELEG